MRIAVSAESTTGLDATVCGHFGHSPCFAFVEVADNRIVSVESLANPHYPQHGHGTIPLFVRENGAAVVLTGGMGTGAAKLLEENGIRAVTGAAGTVREAVEAYLEGRLIGMAPCRQHGDHQCGDH